MAQFTQSPTPGEILRFWWGMSAEFRCPQTCLDLRVAEAFEYLSKETIRIANRVQLGYSAWHAFKDLAEVFETAAGAIRANQPQ